MGGAREALPPARPPRPPSRPAGSPDAALASGPTPRGGQPRQLGPTPQFIGTPTASAPVGQVGGGCGLGFGVWGWCPLGLWPTEMREEVQDTASRGLARIDALRSPAKLLQVCRGHVANCKREEKESAAAVAAAQAAAQHRYSSATAELFFAESRLEAAEISAAEDLSESEAEDGEVDEACREAERLLASRLGLDLAAFRRALRGLGPQARGPKRPGGEGRRSPRARVGLGAVGAGVARAGGRRERTRARTSAPPGPAPCPMAKAPPAMAGLPDRGEVDMAVGGVFRQDDDS